MAVTLPGPCHCTSVKHRADLSSGEGVSPFFSQLGWCGRSQQRPSPFPIPTQTGGLGRGAEEFWFGGQAGSAAGAKHNANITASFGNEETREPQLKRCFTVGTTQLHAACCPLSPTELGQYFTELGNDLWAASQLKCSLFR